MQRGIAAPILIILFGLLAVAVVGYWTIGNRNVDPNQKVKGASTTSVQEGFSILITSKSTWDLSEYLCGGKECIEGVDSGKRFATVSGGATENHEVAIGYSKEWEQYEFVKLYVRSGWGASSTPFTILQGSNLSNLGAEIKTLDSNINVLIIPTKSVKDNFVDSVATFSDDN